MPNLGKDAQGISIKPGQHKIRLGSVILHGQKLCCKIENRLILGRPERHRITCIKGKIGSLCLGRGLYCTNTITGPFMVGKYFCGIKAG